MKEFFLAAALAVCQPAETQVAQVVPPGKFKTLCAETVRAPNINATTSAHECDPGWTYVLNSGADTGGPYCAMGLRDPGESQ